VVFTFLWGDANNHQEQKQLVRILDMIEQVYHLDIKREKEDPYMTIADRGDAIKWGSAFFMLYLRKKTFNLIIIIYQTM